MKRIVAAAELSLEDTVVEVGAGTGILTVALAQEAGRVLAVEVDPHVMPRLRERLAESGAANVEVIEQDILRFDFAQAAVKYGPLKVVGNLPYSVSSPIVFKLLELKEHVPLAVLMFQREVADRISAAPGGKEYGVLSVLVQQSAVVERVMNLDEKHFQPPPKVKSAVLKLTFPSESPQPVADAAVFTRVVKAAFGQRRKMALGVLARSLGSGRERVAAAFAGLGISPSARAEDIPLELWLGLSRSLSPHGEA